MMSAPHTISKQPTSGPMSAACGMPMLAKRPAPRMSGQQELLDPFGQKDHQPDHEAHEDRPAGGTGVEEQRSHVHGTSPAPDYRGSGCHPHCGDTPSCDEGAPSRALPRGTGEARVVSWQLSAALGVNMPTVMLAPVLLLTAALAQASALAAQTMKAAAIDRPGGPEVLTLHTVPVPRPGADEVLIEMNTAGVGPWDVDVRERLDVPEEQEVPAGAGVDGSGIVAAVGSRCAVSSAAMRSTPTLGQPPWWLLRGVRGGAGEARRSRAAGHESAGCRRCRGDRAHSAPGNRRCSAHQIRRDADHSRRGGRRRQPRAAVRQAARRARAGDGYGR